MTKATRADAAAALQQLGLSKYEALVFCALQPIEKATASEIANNSDVPRSQVYGAAEGLEELGLVDVQQSSPQQFRAVGLDEARAHLQAQLEREQDRAFNALSSLQQQPIDETETQEDIWTIKGQKTISDRVAQLISNANQRVIFAARDPSMVTENVIDAFVSAKAADVDILITSENPSVCELFEDRSLEAHHTSITPEDDTDDRSGRVLAIDSDVVLMSVLVPAQQNGIQNEVAFWSDGTGFTSVLIGLLETWFSKFIEA
ncbi:TrmB family transcriptional regulator [Haladaptatus pallidirubidus]|uniref:Transcription regulator TrmB N-terminal domain-containing protein n=1 Tax=Haladaptatus pallidirubidus TaxID=1008152 RepID=A0AAV3UHY5_9EURY|nr:helix-turn-helix domain-containing protein [Haladaptatus pallidirubidus]